MLKQFKYHGDEFKCEVARRGNGQRTLPLSACICVVLIPFNWLHNGKQFILIFLTVSLLFLMVRNSDSYLWTGLLNFLYKFLFFCSKLSAERCPEGRINSYILFWKAIDWISTWRFYFFWDSWKRILVLHGNRVYIRNNTNTAGFVIEQWGEVDL